MARAVEAERGMDGNIGFKPEGLRFVSQTYH